MFLSIVKKCQEELDIYQIDNFEIPISFLRATLNQDNSCKEILESIISLLEKAFRSQVNYFFDIFRRSFCSAKFEDFDKNKLQLFEEGKIGYSFSIVSLHPRLDMLRKVIIRIYTSSCFDVLYMSKDDECLKERFFAETKKEGFESRRNITISQLRDNEIKKIRRFLTRSTS